MSIKGKCRNRQMPFHAVGRSFLHKLLLIYSHAPQNCIVGHGFFKGRLDSLGADLRIEKEIGTFALGRVLNKGRRDSLSADLRIEKEQGCVADRRLGRKGKLGVDLQMGVGEFLSTCI